MNKDIRVFIASSREALHVAEAVNIKLEHEFRVKQWDNAFDLSSMTLPALVARASETDFGVFVFHRDDKATIRGTEYSVVRDNVLFELGLFIGALGIARCFLLVPKSLEAEFRLPTDLAGLTVSSYDDSIDDMVDAVATSCAKIKHAIRKQQAPEPSSPAAIAQQSPVPNPQDQLRTVQSELWMARQDIQRSVEQQVRLLGAMTSQFYALAKPATETEILAWEEGAKDSYSTPPKIRGSKIYYVDRPLVIPPLYGAQSISVIVAPHVTVFGLDQSSHNAVYFMDGFRKSD